MNSLAGGQSRLIYRNHCFLCPHIFFPQVTGSIADVDHLQFLNDRPQFPGCCHNKFLLIMNKLELSPFTSNHTSSTLLLNVVPDVFCCKNSSTLECEPATHFVLRETCYTENNQSNKLKG